MGIAVSLILIAFGAILTWGVSSEPSGLDLDVVGVVLMVVGLVGLLLTLLLWYDWGPGPGRRAFRRSRYVEEDPAYRRPAERREVVVEDDRAPAEPPPP